MLLMLSLYQSQADNDTKCDSDGRCDSDAKCDSDAVSQLTVMEGVTADNDTK